MKRREFITLVSGAAAWPLAARAQQPAMPLIAVLTGVSDDLTARTRASAFVTRLQELGWIDGRNMRLEYRWGRGDAEIIRRQASDLVALAPDVIVTTGGPATERMLQTTRSVPPYGIDVRDMWRPSVRSPPRHPSPPRTSHR